MIKKCDHPDCTKAGVCRAPKSRDSKEYWFFCKEHAAEYNKNWNYYADMTDEEIEDDWERRTFGYSSKDTKKANLNSEEYAKFINDFLTGRDKFDKVPPKTHSTSPVVGALKLFDLSVSASWREVSSRYRALAKKYHPDIAKDKETAASEFAKISSAYDTLKKHFGKK